jgi:hypothetical protein
MATFTMATDDNEGPTAASLQELKAVALYPLEHKTYETKHGERQGLRFRAYDLSGQVAEDLGTGVFFQEVLVEKLSKMMRQWVTGRITKPNKAYLLKAAAPEDHERIAALMLLVADDDLPASYGSDLIDDPDHPTINPDEF